METTTSYNNLYKRFQKKNLNILVVDDDLIGAECIKDILELHDHNVTIIDEPSRCITLCQNNTYDIVFMDYHMEGLDGSQVTSILKEQNVGNTIIFAYTGDSSVDALESFKKTGMNGVIIKPVDITAFDLLIQFFEENNNNQNNKTLITKKSGKNILFFN